MSERNWRRRISVPMLAVAGWLILQTPKVAQACAVCSAGKDEENAAAFLISTLFMSLMPLIAIGTLVYVLYRRIQKLEEERPAEVSPVAQPTE